LYNYVTNISYINGFSIFCSLIYSFVRIILLLMPKEGLIMKKIIKFFKLLKRRIDIYNAEAELKFKLENK